MLNKDGSVRKPIGRKPTVIDEDEVFKLAKLGCKNPEIADWFGISTSTLITRFAPIMAKGRTEIRMSLRRAQLKAALGGNVTMLIWLGKQYLGQSDTPETDGTIATTVYEVVRMLPRTVTDSEK